MRHLQDFKESIQQTIKAIEVFDSGGEIEWCDLGSDEWKPADHPMFILSHCKYRPKQKQPLTQEQAEALVETVLINSSTLPAKVRYVVVQTTDSGVWVKGLQLYSSTLHISYETLMNGFWESKEGIKLWR